MWSIKDICGFNKDWTEAIVMPLYLTVFSWPDVIFWLSGCWGWLLRPLVKLFSLAPFSLNAPHKNPSELINVCVLKTDMQFFITVFTNGMSMSDAPLSLTSWNVWPVQIMVLSIIWPSHHSIPLLPHLTSVLNKRP